MIFASSAHSPEKKFCKRFGKTKKTTCFMLHACSSHTLCKLHAHFLHCMLHTLSVRAPCMHQARSVCFIHAPCTLCALHVHSVRSLYAACMPCARYMHTPSWPKLVRLKRKGCYQVCCHKATEAIGVGQFPNRFPKIFLNELPKQFPIVFANIFPNIFLKGFLNGLP